METEEEDLVVTLSTEESSSGRLRNILGVVRLIWTELTAGVGAWGSLKPLVAGVLAAVPFFSSVSTLIDSTRRASIGCCSNYRLR